MKKTINLIIFLMLCSISDAQITKKPFIEKRIATKKNIESILTFDYTFIILDCDNDYRFGGKTIISENTFISYTSPTTGKKIEKKILTADLPHEDGPHPIVLGEKLRYEDFHYPKKWVRLCFPRIEEGVSELNLYASIRKNLMDWSINGIKIKKTQPTIETSKLDSLLAQRIEMSKNKHTGHYSGENCDYAFVQNNDENAFSLLIDTDERMLPKGYEYARLRETANSDMFTGECDDGRISVIFENAVMTVRISETGNIIEESQYIRIKDDRTEYTNSTESDSVSQEKLNESWSGSGFALKEGYLVTNYHVVEGAKNIEIYGIDNDFSKGYKASIIGFDKIADLALIKIRDEAYQLSEKPKYIVNFETADVGEKVFILGYPMTQIMGGEIKLTDGIVSAKSGFEGDVKYYQITAAIQPGNSGGPMFNSRGEIIGITTATLSGAQNANYAIKTIYLKNLIESTIDDLDVLPNKNDSLKDKDISEQVKQIKRFVYLIKCRK